MSSAAAATSVQQLMCCFKLEMYAAALDANGYDDLEFLLELGSYPEELKEVADEVKMKPGHKSKFCLYMADMALQIGTESVPAPTFRI